MKLYINRDIAADADKMRYWLSGDDAVSYTDIAGALAYMGEYFPDDNRIDLEIHSCGGDCVEGYAIYDALRASGKEISACVVGQCASMASVILLAAPAERRTMYEHAQLLIHEPYYPAGLQGAQTLDKLEAARESLESEKARMLAVYVERTGASEAALLEQIADGGWFGAERALELGFVSSIVPAASASVNDEPRISTTQTQNKQTMEKEKKSAIASAFAALGKALGLASEEPAAAGMVITDVNGTEIDIDREEGEPQVGDTTNAADGEYVLEDGRTLVVKDGTITEIREAEPDEKPDEDEDTTGKTDDEDEDKDEETDEDEDEEKKQMRAEIESLKQQLADAQAAATSENDKAVLEAIAKVGGFEAVKACAVGLFDNPKRGAAESPSMSSLEAHIRQRIAEREAKRTKK